MNNLLRWRDAVGVFNSHSRLDDLRKMEATILEKSLLLSVENRAVIESHY